MISFFGEMMKDLVVNFFDVVFPIVMVNSQETASQSSSPF